MRSVAKANRTSASVALRSASSTVSEPHGALEIVIHFSEDPAQTRLATLREISGDASPPPPLGRRILPAGGTEPTRRRPIVVGPARANKGPALVAGCLRVMGTLPARWSALTNFGSLPAVNRLVAGSNPARGANKTK